MYLAFPRWAFGVNVHPARNVARNPRNAASPGTPRNYGAISVYVGIFRPFTRWLYRENALPNFTPRAKLPDRLLGGKEAKLMYILEFLDHLLGGFTAKTTIRISFPCGTSGSPTRRERCQINVYVEFLDHLLMGFTAETTL